MASDSLDPNPVMDLTGDGSGGTVIQLSWVNPTSLFGGDTIPDYENDLYRDGSWIESTVSGITNYVDTPVYPGTIYEYTVITRLVENDSTSVPVTLSVAAEAGDCQLGDPNMDGIINVMDMIKTLQFIMEWDIPTPNEFCATDVDFDNTITVYDLLLISDIILGD
jgi:hypothetical protein